MTPSPASDEDVEVLRRGPAGVLCYVGHGCAWFTTAPLTGRGMQWGDDWDDAPYEHNAGTPYSEKGVTLTAVRFHCDALVTPDDNVTNSHWSVEDINAGKMPWLRSSSWSGSNVQIRAGATFGAFYDAITQAGGEVFAPWPKALLARLTATEAALSEKQASETAVTVKALEWFKDGANWCAYGQFGQGYRIYESTSDFVFRLMFSWSTAMWDVQASTLDEAKAAAQADYEARIRSALVTAPTAEDTIARLTRERDDACRMYAEGSMTKRAIAAEAALAEKDAEIARLVALANEAIDDIEAWAAYASDYFKDKHDLAGTVADLRARALTQEQT